MTIEMAIDIINNLLSTSLSLIAPLLGAAIFIGVGVSVMQTVTSIQEQTLTFVPKLLGIGIVLLISSNWMLRTLVEFCTQCIQRMGNLGP